ncbi:putative transmembrane protein [Senna tora]|uniref:Putative transmembrane protein n=1 Tax=Senna tora TaxID=362788 RepID=A0A834WRG7_9FABA|nr:putative transmembrane protein [Senna tora]
MGANYSHCGERDTALPATRCLRVGKEISLVGTFLLLVLLFRRDLLLLLDDSSGSISYGIACDDANPLQLMSFDGTRFMVYTYVMESLGVKPPLIPFEMKVLNCLSICPTQLTANAWIVLCGFQLQCHRLQIPPTLKGIHPFWLDERNCPLFPLVWGQAKGLPLVPKESLTPSEWPVVVHMSQRLEDVKDLPCGAVFLKWSGLVLFPFSALFLPQLWKVVLGA